MLPGNAYFAITFRIGDYSSWRLKIYQFPINGLMLISACIVVCGIIILGGKI